MFAVHRLALALAGCLLACAACASVPADAHARMATSCPRVEVLASRGSGDALGKDKGLSAPGSAFVTSLTNTLKPRGIGLESWANPYNAVGVFSLNLRKLAPELLNGAGAASQLSGLGLGAYHDSVVGGTKDLAGKIAALVGDCRGKTELVLVGYSQGAQVTADVFQRDLTPAARSMVAAVVLFGDTYFNGGDRAVDRGSYSGRRDGFLGRRATLAPGEALILSYCHSHDPVCQGILFRVGPTRTIDPGALTFQQHINYSDHGEPQQAAQLVAKLTALSKGGGTTSPVISIDLTTGAEQITLAGVKLLQPGDSGLAGVLGALSQKLGKPRCEPTNAGSAPADLAPATYYQVTWNHVPGLRVAFWGTYGGSTCADARVFAGLSVFGTATVGTSLGALRVGHKWAETARSLSKLFQYSQAYGAYLARYMPGPCGSPVMMQVHVTSGRISGVDFASSDQCS